MTGMLASVTNIDEARIVLNAGANIIDLKDPSMGALGALDTIEIRKIREKIGPQTILSATIGDLPMVPNRILNAVTKMTMTGVNYVKIGFFPGGDWMGTINALAKHAQAGIQLVAVFFGDTEIDTKWVAILAKAGFSGAMIDTRNKNSGSLTTVCSKSTLKSFVKTVQAHQLLCGLAGSLRKHDIPQLLQLGPDYLGFRGALCIRNQRTKSLDEAEVRSIRILIGNNHPYVGRLNSGKNSSTIKEQTNRI